MLHKSVPEKASIEASTGYRFVPLLLYERLRRYLKIGQLLICKIQNSRYFYRIEATQEVGDSYILRCGDAAHWFDEGHLSSGNAWLFEFDFTNNTVKYWFEEV